MRQDRTILLYALVKGYKLNVGRIVEESILDYAKEEEERCPKASPLTLARILKAPVESEKGERREKTKKRKSVEREEPGDQALPL